MPEEHSQTIMAVDELQAIIQRCQILEEADFKGEDFNLFQVAGQKCLEDGYAAQLLEVIQNEKNKVIIKNMGWNLISPLVRCIFMYKQEDDKREHCLRILDQLAQLCNPKELFLGLLEQIEQTSGEQVCQTVMLLLQPLQTVLLKLQNKKAYSVGLSLAMIMNQLTPLPVPYTKQQIQEDKLGLCQCCNAVVDFAKPFVNEVVKNMEKSSEYNDMELKEELIKFCMQSLKYPLLTAQLEQLEGIEEHPFRRFATEIIDILWNTGELIPLVFVHHKGKSPHWENQEFADIERKNSADSLACLSYLMFVQHFGVESFPVVFSPSYLLLCNMTHIEVLLKRTEESVLSKGLDLFESCLLRMEDNSLLHHYLEFRDFINVPQDLVKIMTLCPMEHMRKKSLSILQLFIDKFDTEGKYTLFRCLLKTSNHAGVEGYIIKNIKDQIHLALTKEYDNIWFTGHHLISLLDLVLSLPEGAETDLLQNSDRIMASLNLLRYLVIKDCESDSQTGVWTTLGKIEQNFLKPLRVGLNMSRAHYEAEIKNKKENRKEAQSSNTVCSVTVSGEKMPAMTTGMQLQVLHSALFTFDLIESVLARVEELIEVKTKAVMDENS
ncbi:glomulin isoform X1 [Passer montanus]|uniref:glomulin isoform X1 n=1 Tax=Passer montanus TaxID=9160 RepID=UPI001960DD25|nr:glomulin isoform X1 [Passer montanus]XP_039583097.1 glomulin isoform X2 [Passer montanus]XP_039583098.1 glomulin isoform X1 [Passer montanus]XP_039583099.1 glomulin isoform X1 [Passer montanus]XP_039583100.1 glomulin isoform X1 [Passer montanus]